MYDLGQSCDLSVSSFLSVDQMINSTHYPQKVIVIAMIILMFSFAYAQNIYCHYYYQPTPVWLNYSSANSLQMSQDVPSDFCCSHPWGVGLISVALLPPLFKTQSSCNFRTPSVFPRIPPTSQDHDNLSQFLCGLSSSIQNSILEFFRAQSQLCIHSP